jgi:toxin FitB
VSYLLDTNLLSEPMRPGPDTGVLTWLAAADEDDVFVSAISFLEIRCGIHRLAPGKKQSQLESWLRSELRNRFAERIIPVDADVAEMAGRLIAASERKGRPIEARDACIAGTAVLYGLTLVTRNVSDFEVVLDAVLSPWSRGSRSR